MPRPLVSQAPPRQLHHQCLPRPLWPPQVDITAILKFVIWKVCRKKRENTDNNSNAWKIGFLTVLGWPGLPQDCHGTHGTSDCATSVGTSGAGRAVVEALVGTAAQVSGRAGGGVGE